MIVIKILITSVALIILLTFFMIFQIDMNIFIGQKENIKKAAVESANTAALFFEEYENGKRIFIKDECEKAVGDVLNKNLKLDSEMKFENQYIDGVLEYEIIYFDDGNTVFPSAFDEYGVNILITEPTVIVIVNNLCTNFRLEFLNNKEFIVTSISEDAGY